MGIYESEISLYSDHRDPQPTNVWCCAIFRLKWGIPENKQNKHFHATQYFILSDIEPTKNCVFVSLVFPIKFNTHLRTWCGIKSPHYTIAYQ